MRASSPNPSPSARAVALDPELFRARSLLIYVRSSLVLSLLLYAMIATMLYSDLYVHLIRQTQDAFRSFQVIPGGLFIVLMAGALTLAIRMEPVLERAAMGIVAMSLAMLFLRAKIAGSSDAYLSLCLFSLVLDLALLATVIAFYRKYPNVLKLLRQKARE